MTKRYSTVDEWLYEQENFGVRAERIPAEAIAFVREAWRLGAESTRAIPHHEVDWDYSVSDETIKRIEEIERLGKRF